MDLDNDDLERLGRAVGGGVLGIEFITDRGYTQNRRMLVRLADGRTVFAKQATDAPTAEWLRAEHEVYRHLRGAFMAEMLGWYDDGTYPVLVLEDLTDSQWPPPWRPQLVEAVRSVLSEVAAHPVPAGLRPLREYGYMNSGWDDVVENPDRLLRLGLCSARWLDKVLPVLLEAADPALLDGSSLLHLDVRSDNLCFPRGRTVLFDWNHAVVGNPDFDVAFWLPGLAMEGGPPPDSVTDLAPGLVSLVAGFFAGRAGLPVIPQAPLVRALERRQLEVALPWAARVLDLPPPDGAHLHVG